MRVVLANGVFDLLHIGHLRYLQAAKKMGTYLVVSVTRDRSVNKGPGRPLYCEQDRLDLVREIRCVNSAYLVDDALEALERTRPNVFVKGREYEGRIQPEHERFCREHGISIQFTDTETVRPRDRLGSR